MDTEKLQLDGEQTDASLRAKKPVKPWLAVAVAVVCIALPMSIGFIGSAGIGNPEDIDWWKRINKPPWMPPGWVFGVVWTILYVLMGAASFLLWFFHVRHNIPITLPVLTYGVSLILNGIWTPIFFGKGWFVLGLIDNILLFATVVICIWLFWRVTIAAGIMMIPYSLWLMVAFSLNAYIVIYNPDGKNQNLPTTTALPTPSANF